MFTGIVEETGRIESIQPRKDGMEMVVRARRCGRGVKTGDSIAVNGCCLTVEKITHQSVGAKLQFALLAESWQRTTFQFCALGSPVNLERALRAGDRFGGHLVTGHIDGMGEMVQWKPVGKDYLLKIKAPPEIAKYIILKGSIAVDGISLTVAGIKRNTFKVWIIPHTRKATALQARQVGDFVNLEADLIGKYVEQFTAARR